MIRSVTVYCASSSGNRALYKEAAHALGTFLGEHKLNLVYGGAHVGLMGVCADAVLGAGGKVIGVIPEQLVQREVAHTALSELFVVKTMHERKQKMVDLGDAFVALPGGFGTLDEVFEIATWAQLAIHQKPIVLINVSGYYDHLLKFLDHAVGEGLLAANNRAHIAHVQSVAELSRYLLPIESASAPR
jgi:uncharacterized protein (TIGR00730 family)